MNQPLLPQKISLATLPTALEPGPDLDTPGADPLRLWVKRDDLTGLGGGGNKARKLEYLCADALAHDARSLITVGAAQSNHCRMTAAAGARLGLEVHLVLSGREPAAATGNQLLSTMFGAALHFTGADEHDWARLETVRAELTDELTSRGDAPYSIPIGGSTSVGALGYVEAFAEISQQCRATGIEPAAIVFTSSSGGTHAGLLAGRAIARASGQTVPDVIAIGVAKGVNTGSPDIVALANRALARTNVARELGVAASVTEDDVEVDTRWIGDDYAIPTNAGRAAVSWAAGRAGWLMDQTYSGKGFSGLLGLAGEGRFDGSGGSTASSRDVVFIHTGGWPALFA